MTFPRQRVVVLSAVVAALIIVACDKGEVIDPGTGDEVWRVAPRSATLTAINATIQLETVDPLGNPMLVAGVSRRVIEPDVVQVDETGRVTASAPGTARVVVETSAKADTATIEVRQNVMTVAISPSSTSLVAGATRQLSSELRDANGFAIANRPVAWSSSASGIASVSDNGLVTAHAAGSATITGSSGGRSGTAAITVSAVPPAPVATVQVTPSTATLDVGQTQQLSVVLRDAGGAVLTGRAVSWSTSASGVAGVSGAGLVTAAGAGNATITATSEGRTGTATITVNATVPAPVASVTVTPGTLGLTPAQTGQLTATLRDAGGAQLTGRTVTWSTNASAVATVSTSGLVTAQAVGTATITASSEGRSGTSTVTVTGGTSSALVWSDNFDAGTLRDPNRWHDITGDGMTRVTASGEGITAVGGSGVLRVGPPGGAISHFVSTAATSPYERLYLSFHLYRTSAYQAANPGLRAGGLRGSTTQWGSYGVGYNTTGSCPDDPNNRHAQEFMFAYIFQDGSWPLRTYTNWLGIQKLNVNPPRCGGGYAMGGGNNPAATYHDVNFIPTVNAWHFYEIEVRLNDVGQSNGWQRIWVDGVLKIEHLNVMYRTTSGMKLWAVTFDAGGVAGGPYYVDELVVRTSRP